MIAIVNYGSGNINAIANIYKRLNIPATIAVADSDPTYIWENSFFTHQGTASWTSRWQPR